MSHYLTRLVAIGERHAGAMERIAEAQERQADALDAERVVRAAMRKGVVINQQGRMFNPPEELATRLYRSTRREPREDLS